MSLNYWSLSDEGGNDLAELDLGVNATTDRPTSNSSFSNVYHILSRSDSTETIRASTRRKSPPPLPRQRHAELPHDRVFTPPGPSSSKPSSKTKGKINVPYATSLTPSPPQWTMENVMIKLSGNIHDGCPDLNPAFDYKYISREDITGHLIYQRIKLELLVSAYRMAYEDLEHAPDANSTRVRVPLLVRHVRSLRDLPPHIHAHGDKRELHVAFLTMFACKHEIGTLSANKLGEMQTEVYRQIANQLEADMKREYEQAYGDAKRKVRKFR
ncbi:hypothetical protein J132_07461 [Termitomyces sp. J132]|nr:hypothetical protein C0989_002757 [Termitomyces sp. Mn162]KAH0588164.1 hypothetical protein H2248_006883 [Termitomyces sp. 'cryptogamus']KNZ77067.1 hypothetical protein J132_07461 [Termitomyces sp. J132]